MTLAAKMMVRRLRGKKITVVLYSFIVAWAMAMMVAGLYSSEAIETSASSYLERSGMPDLIVSLYEDRTPGEIEEALGPLAITAYDLRLKVTGQVAVDGGWSKATIIGITDPASLDISRLTILEGRFFTSSHQAVTVAGGTQLGRSAQLLVNGTSFDVDITGVVRSPEYLFNELQAGAMIAGSGGETIIYVPLSTLRSILGGGVNDIAVMLGDTSREEAVSSISSLPVSSMVFQEDHPTVVFINMGANKMSTMLPSISIVFVLIGAVSIFITMYRLVVSDSRNIGVLMSLGVRRRRIAASYLGLGAVTLALGASFGVMLGYGFTTVITGFALQMMGDLPVVIPFSVAPFIIGILFTVGVVLIASLVPVALVLSQDISSALSYIPRSRVWAWRGAARSLAASLGVRNLLRDPKRAAAVMIAVGLTIGAAGSWMVMLDSSLSYIEEQSSSYHWDVSISLTSPRDQGYVVDRFSTGDVERASPFIVLSGLASSGERSAGAVMTASPSMNDMRSFETRSGSLDLEGVVLAKKLADELRVGPGSPITLTFGGKDINLTVTGVVNDLQTNAVYTSNAQAISVLGEGLCQGVWVKLISSDRTEGYISSVATDPWVAGIEPRENVVGSLRDTFTSALSLFYAFFTLNLLIALAVATSAVVVSTSERDLEFTSLSSLGLPRSFVVKSLLVEVGLLALISALLAVPFSFLMAQGFAVLLEEAVFYIPIALTVASALTVLVIGWLFTMPSALWPIRWSKRIDIGRSLRERIR